MYADYHYNIYLSNTCQNIGLRVNDPVRYSSTSSRHATMLL